MDTQTPNKNNTQAGVIFYVINLNIICDFQ